MGRYVARPAVDEDLTCSARWVALDNPEAARRFLDTAFQLFESIAQFPEAGPKVNLRNKRLRNVRFRLLARPFNRWIAFYQIEADAVVILRVLHGARNWRRELRDLL